MSTQPFEPKLAPSAGLVQINSGIEDVIQKRLAEERARLEREAGVVKRETHQFKKPVEHPFTKEQRSRTTLLFGGLTWKHEKLVHGALEGLGYLAEAVPTPNVRAFQTGKEYGNNGQCNPTYFTVGNLVQYLQSLEEQGLTKRKSSTATSSSPPGPAARAASACTKPSIAWPCATRVSTAFACCCSSSPAA